MEEEIICNRGYPTSYDSSVMDVGTPVTIFMSTPIHFILRPKETDDCFLGLENGDLGTLTTFSNFFIL